MSNQENIQPQPMMYTPPLGNCRDNINNNENMIVDMNNANR